MNDATKTTEDRAHPFPHSDEDAVRAEQIPDTPQTRSPAYQLAFTDRDFLLREELRPIRLQLKLLKPQMLLMRALEDAQAIMAGPAIQARCLECPSSALPRKPREAGTFGAWLWSLLA